jgi:hypothetical protein
LKEPSRSDIEDDLISFGVHANGAKGSVTINENTGAFVYTPYLHENGWDSFSLTVGDEFDAPRVTNFSIYLDPVNDPPEPVNINTSGNEGGLIYFTLEAIDVDSTDTGMFDFTVIVPPAGVAAEDVTIQNVSFSGGSFFASGVYLHAGNEEPTDTFTFSADDGEDEATFNGTVTAAITGINDHPYISSEVVNLTIHEDNGTQNLIDPTSGLQEPPPVAFALTVSATDTDSMH